MKTTLDSLKSYVTAMKNTPVLVIGDIMLDRFVYGRVERISPESPVPILSVEREDTMLGGAGNALANLIGLEAKAIAIGLIGDDAQGQIIREKAEMMGIDTRGLMIDKTRPTIVKTRYLAGHQQLLRSDYETHNAMSEKTADSIKFHIDTLIKDVRAVIISDYGKGMLRADIIAHVIAQAKTHEIPAIVDPKGRDFSIYKGATAITPNKKELSDAADGVNVESDSDIMAAATNIIKTCGIQAVVATRSADGMSVIESTENNTDYNHTHYKGADIEVFDVSGAGDSVIATITAAMAGGASLTAAAHIANIAGSIVVTKVGTAPIRASELITMLDDPHARTKTRMRKADICGHEEALEQVKRWKARGLKTGFTNGCFDILHLGHVSYLNEARAHCDRLIVGLNCDASVKILKGSSRPVHDEHSRASVLAALGCVDMVVLFGAQTSNDDNTARALISHIQPDIYFKGGDYAIEDIPEAKTVQSYGGAVEIMNNVEGHSTTQSIENISKK